MGLSLMGRLVDLVDFLEGKYILNPNQNHFLVVLGMV